MNAAINAASHESARLAACGGSGFASYAIADGVVDRGTPSRLCTHRKCLTFATRSHGAS